MIGHRSTMVGFYDTMGGQYVMHHGTMLGHRNTIVGLCDAMGGQYVMSS